jgi:hypothetical protein
MDSSFPVAISGILCIRPLSDHDPLQAPPKDIKEMNSLAAAGAKGLDHPEA